MDLQGGPHVSRVMTTTRFPVVTERKGLSTFPLEILCKSNFFQPRFLTLTEKNTTLQRVKQ